MNPAQIILGSIFDIVSRGVQDKIADPSSPLRSEAPITAGRDVAREVEREVQRIPEVAHATNMEPWWQSRVTWGALVSGAAGVASAFGFALAPEDTDVIIGVLTATATVLGAAFTLYGRWRARRPIGA